MREPPEEEIDRLFSAWFNQEKYRTETWRASEAFTAGYMLCWKQFEEFVKSETGG